MPGYIKLQSERSQGNVWGSGNVYGKRIIFELGMFPQIPIMEDYQLSPTLKEALALNLVWQIRESILQIADIHEE